MKIGGLRLNFIIGIVIEADMAIIFHKRDMVHWMYIGRLSCCGFDNLTNL